MTTATHSRPMVRHYRDTRLFVNAGIEFPTCYAGAALLDTDKARLWTTAHKPAVTCKRCLRIIRFGRPKTI